jgi:hypothetical protein
MVAAMRTFLKQLLLFSVLHPLLEPDRGTPYTHQYACGVIDVAELDITESRLDERLDPSAGGTSPHTLLIHSPL